MSRRRDNDQVSVQPTALKIITILGLAAGVVVAYTRPEWPLLGYWLLLSMGLGIAVSLLPSLSGLGRRAKWLLSINAAIVAIALATTQIAARRAISSTHLEYRGVHLVGVNAFTVGAGGADADVHLQSTASTSTWSVRVARDDSGWTVEPLAGIEQLRVSSAAASRSDGRFRVAQSGILASDADWVAVADPSGAIVDTLRLVDGRLTSARADTFLLAPVNGAIASRYSRQLRNGVALASLDGSRRTPSAYERFVRVQTIGSGLESSESTSFIQRVVRAIPIPGRSRPLLIAASPPYTLRGPSIESGRLSFADSAIVEVRNGDVAWRFELRRRRREPSADIGLDVLFERNPRPLDTPLPTGTSCRPGVACGAISLRRLPPPVAHVALDFAGFDPSKYGMIGRVQQDANGFTVVLPRQTYRVDRSSSRPVAIPVTSLAARSMTAAAARGPSHYWVLLAASGTFGDDMPTIALIGLGLALVLAALYTGVEASMPTATSLDRADERWLSLGVTAILALLLTRVVIGARVAFFAPFLRRSIETAIGMWVAIAIVTVGLLSWSAWVPPLLARARMLLSGQIAPRQIGSGLLRAPGALWSALTTSRTRLPAGLTVAALVCLTAASRMAVINGVVAGGVVLLAWLCLAWVAAFAGPYFETFERGPWTVVEQLAPSNRLAAATAPIAANGWMARLERWCARVPELPIIVACLAAELALLPRAAGAAVAASVAVIAVAVAVIRKRRASGAIARMPDYWGALAGAALFTLAIALLRSRSENGSMPAFVLIVFVALVSVRIGRGVGSRIESAERGADARASGRAEILASSVLLIAPLVLLAPLMFIDMGLFLVVVLPVGFATLLAAGRRVAGPRLVIPGAAFVLLFGLLAPRVLFPSVRSIRDADSHASRADAFTGMTKVFGIRLPFVSTSMDRVAARSVATVDRTLAEELLVSAKPGPARDLLIPSIEQIWGGTTYASSGFWGGGLGQAVVGGRGVAEPVSYAENTFSVFVLAEHGVFGGLLVLSLYLLLTFAVGSTALSGSSDAPGAYRASRALFLVATLIVAIPAAYVALSNLGVVPITGQNMPFLGLNAWSDVAICAGVVGILITGAIRRTHETAR